MNSHVCCVARLRVVNLMLLLSALSFPMVAQVGIHPGGQWGSWSTFSRYPHLQARVKCEYWNVDLNDKRQYSMWAFELRSTYSQAVDVVAANGYYDMTLKANKNWGAPGMFTIQPGATGGSGETTLLGACPQGAGSAGPSIAVYCVVPTGQTQQSCWDRDHGALRADAPAPSSFNGRKTISATDQGSANSLSSASRGKSNTQTTQSSDKQVYWVCIFIHTDQRRPNMGSYIVFSDVFSTSDAVDTMALGKKYTADFVEAYRTEHSAYDYVYKADWWENSGCRPQAETREKAQAFIEERTRAFSDLTPVQTQWTPNR
jgi:hypothetical protein